MQSLFSSSTKLTPHATGIVFELDPINTNQTSIAIGLKDGTPNTAIYLRWSLFNGTTGGGTVIGTNNSLSTDANGNVTYTITGLTPSTKYTVGVDEVPISGTSNFENFSTYAVSNFVCTSTTDSIIATWTPNASMPATMYAYAVTEGPGGTSLIQVSPTNLANATGYTFTGLQRSTMYVVGLFESNSWLGTGPVFVYGYGGFVSTLPLVCFAEGTPVTTDQGQIPIEQINPATNTIDNKRIVSISKGGTADPNLVLLKKDCLGPNKPCQDTVLTLMHQVLYQGRMLQAQVLPNRELIPYTNTPVYNVELETLDTMVVNNLIVETAYPKTLNGSKLQQKNMKCLQPNCQFKRHADIKNNGGTHCCLRCKFDGTHGDFCMRLSM